MSAAMRQASSTEPEAPPEAQAWSGCPTCGRYFAGSGPGGLCSADCARSYERCVNCGGYFQRGQGFDADHCSRECAVRYRLERSYGLGPLHVVTEV